jgi:hypothetical protein
MSLLKDPVGSDFAISLIEALPSEASDEAKKKTKLKVRYNLNGLMYLLILPEKYSLARKPGFVMRSFSV